MEHHRKAGAYYEAQSQKALLLSAIVLYYNKNCLGGV